MANVRRLSATPATYRITVFGHIDPKWSSRLGGMSIASSVEDGEPVTVLLGGLADQAALLSVLNTLGAIGYPLRSVEQRSVLGTVGR